MDVMGRELHAARTASSPVYSAKQTGMPPPPCCPGKATVPDHGASDNDVAACDEAAKGRWRLLGKSPW